MLESERQRTLLANYGYSAERLKEGLALHHHAWELFIDQSSQYGASIAAINRHHAAQASARSIFAQHRAIAQVALRGERALAQALGLGEQCPRAQTAWQHYAEQFYANALNDEAILAHLTAYGVNAEQIAVGQRQLAAVSIRCGRASSSMPVLWRPRARVTRRLWPSTPGCATFKRS
ncbi:MAG TPA: hypothetical protein PLO33_14010 [Kouleothrix sp.]|uniref:hypothetical protein n=1 Tax=Kouleothrix sp. TaxID=2779161 RepID=UPI002B6867A8|nr:hypothetical protein [Kouleothrix sp.]HRC76787.1 hypothetical protein [Kouleothrix sp.]